MTPTSLKEGKKKAVERGKEFYLRVESPVLQFDYPPSHLAPYFRAVFAQTDEEWCYESTKPMSHMKDKQLLLEFNQTARLCSQEIGNICMDSSFKDGGVTILMLLCFEKEKKSFLCSRHLPDDHPKLYFMVINSL